MKPFRTNALPPRVPAFTLIELLVVIAIIGMLAVLGMPALKGFGKANAILAADRQLLDDLATARQRAIAEHTEVYVLFASKGLRIISIGIRHSRRRSGGRSPMS
jgi:prepilin-type N-terminal cleavage/methylation domain-containing protein